MISVNSLSSSSILAKVEYTSLNENEDLSSKATYQKYYFAKQHFVKKHNNLPIIPLPCKKRSSPAPTTPPPLRLRTPKKFILQNNIL
jgi:hypothetical protein